MKNYVGIVLISHSFDLVKGLRELVSQVQPHVPIAIAGGTDDGGIGTNSAKIKAAIEEVASEAGVVVLFDLGSALINAELAVQELEGKADVRIVDAPLVEGAYAAVIESGCGGSLDEVSAVARESRNTDKML